MKGEPNTITNNQINGININYITLNPKPNAQITVYSDSKYVVDAIEKKWVFAWSKKNFNKKKNPDLWRRFLVVYKKHQIKFVWVKGHSNNKENNRCDYLAVSAAESTVLEKDVWYEKETSSSRGV